MPEWTRREIPAFSQQSDFDGLLADFFAARGFTSADKAREFLNFSLRDLKDPSVLKDMDKALNRLAVARERQENVCVYGDYDMDGTPGVALLVRGLRGMGFENVFYCQPDRHKDGYGFHAHLAEKLILEKKIQLFVTVDVGITDVEAVEKVSADGADVIVTDHHQVQERVPPAAAVVNPNQPECKSGMGYLCGTGVAFYMMLGLRRELKKRDLLETDFDVKSLLDCFAIATVADLVPMVFENRILVKHGLKLLEKTPMIGLRLLLAALKLHEKKLSAQDVGLRFVPKLNSLTRMDTDLKPIDIFLVEDPGEAGAMIEKVLKNNSHRVHLLGEAEILIDNMVQQGGGENHFFYWSESFHKGLVGLLATHLTTGHHKPAFVGAQIGDVIVGSARSPEGSGCNVFEALQKCSSTLNKFGGHPAAAGFELDMNKAEEFDRCLTAYFASQEKRSAVKLTYDREVTLTDLKNFMQWWDNLEPFGVTFAQPVFRMDSLKLEKVTVMKGGHLKVLFSDGSRAPVECVWFFPEDKDFLTAKPANHYSILCEPQWNEFMGSRRLQLLIKDIKAQI